MLEIGLDGFDGSHFEDIGGVDVHFALEGEEVVGGQDNPTLPPLAQELRALVKHPLLDLVVLDLVVDDAVVHQQYLISIVFCS